MHPAQLPQKPPWHSLLVLLALWLLAFAPILPGLYASWLDPENSHGPLVPFIVLYLVWLKKEDLGQAKLGTSRWGLAVTGAGLLVYVLAQAGSVAVASRAMLVVTLMGLVLFNLGPEVFRRVAFPLAFLFFMVPFPDSLVKLVAFPLQLLASNVSASLIGAMSIPVYQEGNMLHFVQTQLEVAEACSGIRSIVSLTMLSTIFSYLLPAGGGRRLLLAASAIPVAIAANIVRVSGTGILANFYGGGVAQGFLHEFSGLAVFAFGFLAIYGEYLLFRRGAVHRPREMK
ncbi:MAG: exosortase/archaeosortase family protein [Desulfobacteraceae bacterium]|nr:exosortase/archaeosortase family protein [Desulfobacteraceae bacterium]